MMKLTAKEAELLEDFKSRDASSHASICMSLSLSLFDSRDVCGTADAMKRSDQGSGDF
jgi:hypothetical protein